MPKFVPRSRIGIFRNERTRSSPLDPKLTFWCVSHYLGVFGILWLPCETRYKTGQTSAKVRATKSHRNFSQRKHPIHPIGPQTAIFWLPYETRCKTGRTSAKVCATKLRRYFLQRTHPIHPIGPQNSCFGVFHTIWVHLGPFGCLTKLGGKWAGLLQKFMLRSRIGIFRKERT